MIRAIRSSEHSSAPSGRFFVSVIFTGKNRHLFGIIIPPPDSLCKYLIRFFRSRVRIPQKGRYLPSAACSVVFSASCPPSDGRGKRRNSPAPIRSRPLRAKKSAPASHPFPCSEKKLPFPPPRIKPESRTPWRVRPACRRTAAYFFIKRRASVPLGVVDICMALYRSRISPISKTRCFLIRSSAAASSRALSGNFR